MYKNKATWWLEKTNRVWQIAQSEQGDRLMEDIWFQPIEKYVECTEYVTVREILESFKIDVKDQTGRQQKQVIDILKSLGFVPYQKRNGSGGPVRGWVRAKKGNEVIDV
jgi:hypothetical protein